MKVYWKFLLLCFISNYSPLLAQYNDPSGAYDIPPASYSVEEDPFCPNCQTYMDPTLCLIDNYCVPCNTSAHKVYAGPIYTYKYASYKGLPGSVLGTEENLEAKGHLFGANFGYETRCLCSAYVRADFSYLTGDMGHPVSNRVNQWRFSGRVGYTWGECSPCGYAITPYVGLGYLQSKHDHGTFSFVENNNTISTSYQAEYKGWFVPLGIYADVEITSEIRAGIDFSFSPMFDTKIKQSASEVSVANRSLSDRYLWNFSVPIHYEAFPHYGLEVTLEPYYEKIFFTRVRAVSEANVVVQRATPELKEDFWGVKLLMSFRF